MCSIANPTLPSPEGDIIMKHNNEQPDIRLQVFDQAFQVHSSVLKENSAFFKRFIDSPEKNRHPASNPKFKQIWVTVVDEVDWYLEWEHAEVVTQKREQQEQQKEDTPVEDAEEQEEAFKTLINAMYNESIVIESLPHLALVTNLADFYCSLPMFSRAISASLSISPKLIDLIPEECARLFEIARKLRIEVLFKECLIHLTGRWGNPQYPNLENEKLKEIAQKAHQSIQRKDSAFREYYKRGPPPHSSPTIRLNHYHYGVGHHIERVTEPFPLFCRKTYRMAYGQINDEDLREVLEPLMTNKLRLDKSDVQAGEGKYRDFFLCADVDDIDLPWDPDEHDW